jgi:hypothetical protein
LNASVAPIRPWLASGLIAVFALAGCGPADSAGAEECGEAPTAAAGELRTVLRASAFGAKAGMLGTAALADGSVVVAYDASPDEAGDADDLAGRVPEPGLVLLRPDGSCAPFPLPIVDGGRVGLDAQPVAVGLDGRLYLWDGAERRLIRGQVGANWETLTVVPSAALHFTSWPAVAVGPEGEVYIATDFLVSRVTGAGNLEPVAGTGQRPPGPDFPLPDPGTFPRPGTSAPLTHLSGIAATPSGGVVITTESAVLELDPSGTLHLVADPATTAGQDGAIEALHVDEGGSVGVGSHLGAVEVTDAGDILVSDQAKKRILRIHDGRSTVFVTDSAYLSLSRGHAFLADDAGLLLHRDGGQSLAVLGLPPD